MADITAIPAMVAERAQTIRNGLLSGSCDAVDEEHYKSFCRIRELANLVRHFGGPLPVLPDLSQDRMQRVHQARANGEPIQTVWTIDEAMAAADALVAWAVAKMGAGPQPPASTATIDASLPPDDDENYIPAKRCRWCDISTNKKLRTVIKRENIRIRHHGQHLLVHAADWERYVAKREQAAQDAMDDPAVSEALEEVADRKAEISARKRAKG